MMVYLVDCKITIMIFGVFWKPAEYFFFWGGRGGGKGEDGQLRCKEISLISGALGVLYTKY